jgi:hypothetical protein
VYKSIASSHFRQLASRGLASLTLIAVATSMAGCGKGAKSVAGLDNFHMGVLDGKLVVSFLSETLHLNGGGSFPIPGLKDATLGINPDLQSTGTVFTFSVDPTTLASSLSSGGKSVGLPGGQPIPDVTGGTLPEWDVKVAGADVSLYLSNDIFGFFVPMTFLQALPATVSQDIDDSHGNILGRVYAIPAAGSGSESGLLILVPYVSGTLQ